MTKAALSPPLFEKVKRIARTGVAAIKPIVSLNRNPPGLCFPWTVLSHWSITVIPGVTLGTADVVPFLQESVTNGTKPSQRRKGTPPAFDVESSPESAHLKRG